ncbi:hypothetical protein IID10_19365 [candidate division KSB1 bacterium]|nr:hypothetical protein [candidate division KSB1 bacterium]TDI93980.1 MAG: hypothetical protein E2O76_16375 [Caldithrix sp.]
MVGKTISHCLGFVVGFSACPGEETGMTQKNLKPVVPSIAFGVALAVFLGLTVRTNGILFMKYREGLTRFHGNTS